MILLFLYLEYIPVRNNPRQRFRHIGASSTQQHHDGAIGVDRVEESINTNPRIALDE